MRQYVPAAGRDFFLPLYDPISRLFGFQAALEALLVQAALRPGHLVLDVGCGTGTLAIAIKQRWSDVDVTGVDPDPRALARAARKAARAAVPVRFTQGFGDALPHADATFDRVFSTMMFHHLGTEDKPRVLAEIRRVLKAGGRLEFMDFAGGTHGFLAQIVHGHQPLAPAGDDRLLRRLRDAGFADAWRTGDRDTLFGRIAYYEAVERPRAPESKSGAELPPVRPIA
jgi:SAM-dependent methyltransferase